MLNNVQANAQWRDAMLIRNRISQSLSPRRDRTNHGRLGYKSTGVGSTCRFEACCQSLLNIVDEPDQNLQVSFVVVDQDSCYGLFDAYNESRCNMLEYKSLICNDCSSTLASCVCRISEPYARLRYAAAMR